VNRPLPALPIALLLACLLGGAGPAWGAVPGAGPPGGQDAAADTSPPEAFAEPSALEWRAVFKLINLTSHAEPGEAGFVSEGDDTRESNEQSFRLQLTGQPAGWLDYRFDYLNVKLNTAPIPGLPAPSPATGADLFRRKPLRWYLERPEPSSTQTVTWYHEVDDAYVRMSGGPVEAVLGRQPITWGAGRIWQPTDIFATFSPTALDTEYKPGIDGVLLKAYPFAFSSFQLAYILSPQSTPSVEDSAALRWRGQVGTESEVTLLGARVRGVPLAGGSFETSWLQAGWRLEGVAFRPPDRQDTATYAIAGVDHQLSDGTTVLAELYHDSLGAARQSELPAVLQSRTFRDGRLLQLSSTVLALSASRDFLGLWKGAYTVFAAPLLDDAGARHTSVLHVLTFTYSISNNAEAVFSLSTANGRGLSGGSPQSEFGHVPDSLYVSLQFVL
jgi:hypothetical protein